MNGLLVFLVFIFATYGFSNMVVYSNGPFGVFRKWRELSNKISEGFGELFSCMICFPTWAGMILSAINLFLIENIIMFTPMNLLMNESVFDYSGITFWLISFVIILVDGLIGSGTTWIIHNIEEWFENGK
jgi:hypothetical protein